MGEVEVARWPRWIDRDLCARLADGLAVALVVSLPWWTLATSVLLVLWLIVVVPTIDFAEWRRVISTPAGGVPVLLWVLALVGVLWAIDVPLHERLEGLKSYLRFLFIPLLIVQFRRSERAAWVMNGFLISCGAMLVLSWALFVKPDLPWPWIGRGGRPGIPVKDYIAQSTEFTVCVLLLTAIALKGWRERRHGLAIALAVTALVFLANILWVSASRTSLVIIPVLILLFACKQLPWNAMAGLLLTAVIVGGLAWWSGSEVKTNITDLLTEMRDFEPGGLRTRAGERLEFWRKSIGFIAEAPLIGHGTGSIRDQFRRSVAGQSGMANLAAENPHNQTFAVAIQLGLLGTAALFAMWIAHALLFRGEGLAAWAGLVIVVQNIVTSLFNSHLFDSTQGWGYVIGVGVAAGAVLKQRAAPVAASVSGTPRPG